MKIIIILIDDLQSCSFHNAFSLLKDKKNIKDQVCLEW